MIDDRRVVHDSGRCIAVANRRGVHDRLEGRARLAAHLHGPVELAAPEAVAADHRSGMFDAQAFDGFNRELAEAYHRRDLAAVHDACARYSAEVAS